MDAHAKFAPIRSCFALPKVMYVMPFDDVIREAFTRIIASPTSDS
jgi:hypothetical protein